MPGGYKNIRPKDNPSPFTTERQPDNPGRKPIKFLTELLTENLTTEKEITIDGIEVGTGKPTKIKVPMPTRDVIVGALLRQAAKGNMIAIKEVFDRIEGKAVQSMEVTGKDGEPLNPPPAQFFILPPSDSDSVEIKEGE